MRKSVLHCNWLRTGQILICTELQIPTKRALSIFPVI